MYSLHECWFGTALKLIMRLEERFGEVYLVTGIVLNVITRPMMRVTTNSRELYNVGVRLLEVAM